MTHSPHKLTAGYNSVDRVITVTVPGRTLAAAVAPQPTAFARFIQAAAEAESDRAGVVFEEGDEWKGLLAGRDRFADEISCDDPDKQGVDVTIDVTRALDFLLQTLGVISEYGLVSDAESISKAWRHIANVKNAEEAAQLVAKAAA
jgi:hypothetical protein